MKNQVLLLPIFVGLLVGGLPAVQLVQAEQPIQEAQPQWKQFSSPEGGFTILMPVTPTQKSQTAGSATVSLDDHSFTASLEEGKVTYTVSYTNLPEEMAQFPPNLILDSLSSRFTNDSKLKLLNQKDINLERYSGKEFKFEAPGEIIVSYRAYLVEKRLYQVTTEIPKDRESALSSDTDRFMNSFQLVK